MKKLADKICQQLFNNYDLFLHTFYVLQRHMVLGVKGGAAFSLHAQRASAATLAPGSLQLLSNLHLLHVYDLDMKSNGDLQQTEESGRGACHVATTGFTLQPKDLSL